MDLLKVILVIFLILLNAYFVAAEFALVTLRKTRVDELVNEGNKLAKLLQVALDHIDSFISATQLGITIVSLLLGWIGEPAFATLLGSVFSLIPHPVFIANANAIAIIFGFVLITFLQIVIGELAPKTIALQRTEQTAFVIILPLILFARIFSPFIWLLNKTGNGIVKIFGFSSHIERQNLLSEEEIKMLLRQSGQRGLIPSNEIEIVQNVFQLGDVPVKKVMIPRTKILAFNVSTPVKEVIQKIARHPHSRFPVYENTIDTITGFIHVKDIYQEMMHNGGEQKIVQTKIIREVIVVPEIKKIDAVLQIMRRKRIHMAIISDEYGGTEGIVTLEDIIESLIGDIEDEFDVPAKQIIRQKDGRFLVDGSTEITDMRKKFKLVLKGQGYTTIGGLVFGLLGHEPNEGDTVQMGNISLRVAGLEGKRIKQLILKMITKKRKN